MNNSDAHGQVILKYFENQYSFDVVERDDGYINVDEGATLYFSEYKNWKNHEKEGIKFAKGICLDIGTGAGRVPLYLQQKGLYCIAIDTSPLAIKVCKLRGVAHAKKMDIKDIYKFKKNYFDSIIMFGNNFGLLKSEQNSKKFLKYMYDITKKNCTIIAETRDPYITNNPVHFKYHKNNIQKNRMPGQLRIRVRFMQYATPWFDYLYVSKKEMKEILNGTGWKVYKFINSQEFAKNGLYTAIIKKEPKKE